jgi:hypothetical protein
MLTKVIAEAIANSIPDAFAQPPGPALGPMNFDLEADFSDREREAFLGLARDIVGIMHAAQERCGAAVG